MIVPTVETHGMVRVPPKGAVSTGVCPIVHVVILPIPSDMALIRVRSLNQEWVIIPRLGNLTIHRTQRKGLSVLQGLVCSWSGVCRVTEGAGVSCVGWADEAQVIERHKEVPWVGLRQGHEYHRGYDLG